MRICGHKRSIPSPAIFRPAICRALRSRSVSHFESDRIIYAIENIGLIILKRPLKIEDTDPRLKPGLTATLDIIIDRQQNALPVPLSTEPKLNSCLFLGKTSIGATITAFVAKMCKNNFAQVLIAITRILDRKETMSHRVSISARRFKDQN